MHEVKAKSVYNFGLKVKVLSLFRSDFPIEKWATFNVTFCVTFPLIGGDKNRQFFSPGFFSFSFVELQREQEKAFLLISFNLFYALFRAFSQMKKDKEEEEKKE